MNGKRSWLGWLALGIGGIALVVALFGSRFGPQSAAGWGGRQAYAQAAAGNGPQSGAAGPGANAQPGMRQRGNGQQGGAAGPGANAQPGAGQPGNNSQGNAAGPGANVQPGMRQRGNGQQGGAAGPGANAQPGNNAQGNAAGPGANARRGPGQPGHGGFGLMSWLRLPFKLIGGAFQMAMLALLVLLGFWLIRGRNAGSKSVQAQAAPAQASPQGPLSPTGESYSDDSSDQG